MSFRPGREGVAGEAFLSLNGPLFPFPSSLGEQTLEHVSQKRLEYFELTFVFNRNKTHNLTTKSCCHFGIGKNEFSQIFVL